MQIDEVRKPKGKSDYWTKEEWAVYMREYRSKNKERVNKTARKSRLKNIEAVKSRQKEAYETIRREVLIHYSNNELKCACCSVDYEPFLTLDHINGGGRKHTEEVGRGNVLYRWLRKNNFPLGFQVLCYNCNCNKRTKGKCDCPFGK